MTDHAGIREDLENARMHDALDLINTLMAAIGRVRLIHVPEWPEGPADKPFCAGCHEFEWWPCPTITALDTP